MEGGNNVQAKQPEHRIRPRAVGRWLCFQKLIPTLQADGHEVICSQHGLDSLKGDVECVTRCFGRVSGPVILVGHSYGGTLITHAGTDNRVAALVYIAALARIHRLGQTVAPRLGQSRFWRQGGGCLPERRSAIPLPPGAKISHYKAWLGEGRRGDRFQGPDNSCAYDMAKSAGVRICQTWARL
jgi:pimeloyl-ACP methyl ester carboxylesterase